MCRKGLGLLGLVACLLVAGGAPTIDAAEDGKIFFLDFSHEKPQRLIVAHGVKETKPDVFTYMVYTLKNTDDADHEFYLEIHAKTDDGQEVRDGYHPLALQRIREKRGNEAVVVLQDGSSLEGSVEDDGFQLEVDSGTSIRSVSLDEVAEVQFKLWGHQEVTSPRNPTEGATGDAPRPLGKPFAIPRPVIKAGETRECVAIFKGVSENMDRLTVEFVGLTNDVVIETVADHTRKVTYRVFQIVYERPGDEFYPSLDKMTFVRKGWVDREETIKTDLKSPKEAK
jgi:hypothetical protein